MKVSPRLRPAFDVDRLTRRFHKGFKAEHTAFEKSIMGIASGADRASYAALLLNRLMFVYFLQQRCLLDDDPHYLRYRLQAHRQRNGKAGAHSFYRGVLRRLFHEGLGQSATRRNTNLKALLGSVPYLAEGLFAVAEIERANPHLDIADKAFERLFDFLDAYQWRLDEGPVRAANEITPAMLGHLFEQYVNQKQMGAYYTGEDVTGYIACNAIIPFLFNAVAKQCGWAFGPDGDVWHLLRNDPDRYIYPAAGHSLTHDACTSPPCRLAAPRPLPKEIAAGLRDVSQRSQWNRPAPAEFGLPTETWREVIARRQWCEEVRAKLKAGKICGVNDLITWNLDIRQLAQDAIETCDDPALLRAFWKVLESITVLDPTCGSGAFLIAALNTLEPLYEACLERMQRFLADVRLAERLSDFRETLAKVAQHTSRRYYIVKAILVNNLYGVDLMPEAVEICKLRLLLKLAAQVEPGPAREHPDNIILANLACNIRHGNTLVGYSTWEEADRPCLDQCHPPFHWCAEFGDIMHAGGFDVIIGNPPYVELADIQGQYTLQGLPLVETGNLFAICTARFAQLARPDGRVGVILPLSASCTPRMLPLMRFVARTFAVLHCANFAVRPGKLFAGVDMNLSILLGQKSTGLHSENAAIFATQYNRWQGAYRPFLFSTLRFQPGRLREEMGCIPKIGSCLEVRLLDKVLAHQQRPGTEGKGERCESVFYHSGGRYFKKCLRERLSNEYKELKVHPGTADAVVCLLSSSLYYWLWIVTSDCYHVTIRDIANAPLPEALVNDKRAAILAAELLHDLWQNAEKRVRLRADASRRQEVNFRMAQSRPILDEIDRMLAAHFHFSPEELDHILNYDARFRSADST